MRKALFGFLVFLAAGVSAWTFRGSPAAAGDEATPRLETLLRTELEGVAGTEVIVSKVEIPPNSSLPSHYHPGEEFIYVLEGEGIVGLKDKDEVHLKPGEVYKVPLEQVHWAETGDVGVKAVVFRVHKKGAPERIMSD